MEHNGLWYAVRIIFWIAVALFILFCAAEFYLKLKEHRSYPRPNMRPNMSRTAPAQMSTVTAEDLIDEYVFEEHQAELRKLALFEELRQVAGEP